MLLLLAMVVVRLVDVVVFAVAVVASPAIGLRGRDILPSPSCNTKSPLYRTTSFSISSSTVSAAATAAGAGPATGAIVSEE